MNKLDLDYQNLLKDILENGTKKEARNGGTISVFGRQIRHKMSDGFPLLTTKKMAWKTMVTELLWFLKGDTNIKYLVDNDTNIWNGDAYKNYCNSIETSEYDGFGPTSIKLPTLTQEEFINKIKTDDEFAKTWGELGPIYGKQWRNWGKNGKLRMKDEEGNSFYGEIKQIDQIANLINDLKTNPDSRRLMVNAWNVGELDQMVLPPCHYGFQVYTRELSLDERMELYYKNNLKSPKQESISRNHTNEQKLQYLNVAGALYPIPTRAISLMWNQRSVDTFLGLPFNIASYGLLLEIIAKEVNMVPDELIGNLGDVHLYLNHINQANEQIGRYFTHEERLEELKKAMGDFYQTAVDEMVPFGGGLSEYFARYGIRPNLHTREPYPLPTLKFNPIFLANLEHKGFDEAINGQVNFELENYQSHPTIKAPLSN
jgi:thymidylate synthase